MVRLLPQALVLYNPSSQCRGVLLSSDAVVEHQSEAIDSVAIPAAGSGSRQETDSSIAPTVEEIPGPSIAEPVPRVIDSSAPSQSPAPSSMPSPGMPAQGMQQTLQMMHENPALMDQMRNTFASMSPEQMQAAVS